VLAGCGGVECGPDALDTLPTQMLAATNKLLSMDL
jgi:hypothetical protein